MSEQKIIRQRWDLHNGKLLDVLECGHEVEQGRFDRHRVFRECVMCERIAGLFPKAIESSASGDSVIAMLHREANRTYDRLQAQDEEIQRLRRLVRDLGGSP